MTTIGNANSTRASDLTELAFDPSQSEVNNSYRCPIGTHVWWCYGCTINHRRAWQETTPYETDVTWCRCRCLPCLEKHLCVLHHRQVDTGADYSRLIERQEVDIARAHEHLADVEGVLEARRLALLKKQNAANAKSKLGPWEFTLTYSPRQHGWTRDEAQDKMREAITRLTSYYREEIEEFHATGEWNQAGDPHVHCWYRLEGGCKITTRSFQRAYPIWDPKSKTGPRGHVGGHHEPVKRQSDFAGYIQKDLDTAWLMVNISNGPAEETSGPEAAGGGAASSDDASPPSASPESHDG